MTTNEIAEPGRLGRIRRSVRARRRAGISLRARLTALSAVSTMIILAVGVTLGYVVVDARLDEAVTAELRVRADDAAIELAAGAPVPTGGGFVTQVIDAGGTVHGSAAVPPLVSSTELAAALEGETVIDRPVPSIGDGARVLARPTQLPDGTTVAVAVAGGTGVLTEARRTMVVALLVAAPALALLVAASTWTLVGAALRPVRRMSRRAASLSVERSRMRLPRPPGNDALAELGDTLNQMLRRIHTSMQHERAFIDDASHELRTPIAVLRGELELARLDLDDDQGAGHLAAALDSALEETDRLARVADNLLVLARADAGQLVEGTTQLELGELARAVAASTSSGAVAVEIGADRPVELEGDPSSLERVVQNLLSNAVRHADSRVRISVTTDEDVAVLSVADDGPGFDEELLHRAFDRFVRSGSRTRIDGGAGLGLAIVAASAEAMGGTVGAANGPPLGGARVTVRLPCGTSRPTAPQAG